MTMPISHVSVIVCAYRSGSQIIRTLEAILGQSHQSLDLIVIDDASGDDTPDLIRQIKDPRLKLIVNEQNLGVVQSRNKGLGLATGEFIATCDHDDVWRTEKLREQVAYMTHNPSCGVVGTGWLVHGASRKPILNVRKSTAPAFLKWQAVQKNCLLHSSLLMRRSTIEKYNIRYDPGLRFADDWKIVWDFAKVSELGILNYPLVDYYLHGDNWSLQCTGEMHDNGSKNIQEILCDILGRVVADEEARSYFDGVVLGRPCKNDAELLNIGAVLADVFQQFSGTPDQKSSELQILDDLGALWWRMVRCYAGAHGPAKLRLYHSLPLEELPPLSVFEQRFARLKTVIRFLGAAKRERP